MALMGWTGIFREAAFSTTFSTCISPAGREAPPGTAETVCQIGNAVGVNLHRQVTFFATSTIFLTSKLVDIPAEQHSIILNIDTHPQNVKVIAWMI